jgi:hypothetical protein
MSVERRGRVIRVSITLVNWQREEPTNRGEGRQPLLDGTSRVSREAQARFCEGLCQEDAKASCCTEDEGRSFGAALQGEASNCHKLLWSKAMVMNVMVKRRDIDCVM